ncbi:uncharacterized protein LOC129772792 isoform X2 [Toxorhynchites rutilus septentrionalis]|uniref:uncharacterized protein LOC129772792 isoform X2 n=1 Tax=Toxorhynchites rutilus septentrionalis TaxID=329112 RepID=UPI00247B0D5F|nr:uncharacterized protein LOC129772792 isoform X2 [Toxorhynchites rutilus septentrionalis]
MYRSITKHETTTPKSVMEFGWSLHCPGTIAEQQHLLELASGRLLKFLLDRVIFYLHQSKECMDSIRTFYHPCHQFLECAKCLTVTSVHVGKMNNTGDTFAD